MCSNNLSVSPREYTTRHNRGAKKIESIPANSQEKYPNYPYLFRALHSTDDDASLNDDRQLHRAHQSLQFRAYRCRRESRDTPNDSPALPLSINRNSIEGQSAFRALFELCAKNIAGLSIKRCRDATAKPERAVPR